MARYKLDNIELLKDKVNPFVTFLRVEVKETKVLEGKMYLEQDKYVKVFLSAEKRKLICSLPDAGKSLFLWITYSLDGGKDIVQIDRNRCSKELDIRSTATYYKGLNALINAGIICKVNESKHSYWINPQVFFNGSRANKYPDKTIVLNKSK